MGVSTVTLALFAALFLVWRYVATLAEALWGAL